LIGAGVVGGYAISKDSVTDHFDQPSRVIYDRALRVLRDMGRIELEDEAHGVIKADIDQSHVTVTIKPLTNKTVKLQIKARDRWLMPNVSLAQDVYARTVKDLRP
jgi:ABC-type metal ion transport system substrate-binding protein